MTAAKKLAEILKEKGEKNVVLYDLARDDMPSAIADAYRYDQRTSIKGNVATYRKETGLLALQNRCRQSWVK